MKLYGKNPVLVRIKSNPKSIQRIMIAHGHPELAYIGSKARQHGLAINVVPRDQIDRVSQHHNAQGVFAVVDDFAYANFADILAQEGHKKPSLIFCDGLTDPQNLGGIIRSLASLGNFVVLLPTHDSVSVTEAVLRVACGGENFVPVCLVRNLTQAVEKARDAGYWIMGAVVQEGEDIRTTQIQFPAGIVIGSEDKGIRDVMRKRIDHAVTIPMRQKNLSFNVAHATAIFAYEICKQQNAGA